MTDERLPIRAIGRIDYEGWRPLIQADAVFQEDLLSIGPEETQAVSQMRNLADKLQRHQINESATRAAASL